MIGKGKRVRLRAEERRGRPHPEERIRRFDGPALPEDARVQDVDPVGARVEVEPGGSNTVISPLASRTNPWFTFELSVKTPATVPDGPMIEANKPCPDAVSTVIT